MITIHGVPISVNTRKAILVAIEKGLDYRNDPVVPFDPPADWERLSPTGKIPVVTDGELVIRDSSVICAYLERVHPRPSLYPTAPRDYAQALWFEEYADGTLFRDIVHGLFFQRIIRPNVFGEPGDEAAIEDILARAVPKIFGYLESSLDTEFLAAGQFSVADVATVSNLINFHYLGYRLGAQYPKLKAYFAALMRRPSIETALAREAPVAAARGLDTAYARWFD